MSRAEKRSLQSSQKRVRNTIGYHLSPVTITTQTIRGKQAITSHTEKGIKLKLNVIHGVISILYISQSKQPIRISICHDETFLGNTWFHTLGCFQELSFLCV